MKGIDKMKEVRFALISDKLAVHDEINKNYEVKPYGNETINVYYGIYCADGEPAPADYPEAYRVIRTDKTDYGRDLHYSYLGDVDKEIPEDSKSQGILYSKTRILRGAVLRFIEGLDGSPAHDTYEHTPPTFVV